MAKYLLYLLLLLLLPSQSNAQNNYCYCMPNSYHQGTGPYANTTVCTANSDCWACQLGAYPQTWQQNFCSGYTAPAPVVNIETQFLSCPSGYSGSITQTRTITNGVAGPWNTTNNTCTAIITTETQTLSCPIHYSGAITQTRTVTAGVPGYWTTTSNTCRQDPPTCQTSTQTQTLSCQTGYTGSITQSQTSTCPDPYGSPIWPGVWTTTSNTCVKSVTNPTNVTSPVSPISPLNPTSVVSSPAAATTSTVTASATSSVTTVLTPASTPTDSPASAPSSSQTSSGGSSAPTTTPSSATSTPAPTGSAKTTTSTPTKAQQIANTVKVVTTLEIIERNSIKQFDAFPTIPFGLNMPEDLIKYQALGLELIQTGMPTIIQDVEKLKENSLEIEQ
jgi:hypothetical protein